MKWNPENYDLTMMNLLYQLIYHSFPKRFHLQIQILNLATMDECIDLDPILTHHTFFIN